MRQRKIDLDDRIYLRSRDYKQRIREAVDSGRFETESELLRTALKVFFDVGVSKRTWDKLLAFSLLSDRAIEDILLEDVIGKHFKP